MLTISFFYPKIYPLVSQIFSKISLDFVLQRQIIHITFRKLVFKKLDIHTENLSKLLSGRFVFVISDDHDA